MYIRIRLSLLILLFAFLASAQTADNDKIWHEFMDWAKAQPAGGVNGQRYRVKLIEGGLTAAQADERLAVIGKLYNSNPALKLEVNGVVMGKLYSDPNQTRFTPEPNAFLVSSTKDLKPGKALDVCMGQGRNAVYLATKGWDVTGFDIAEEGMKVANENAAKAGAHIATIRATFEEFDYGKEKWDLIYFVYTDVPHVDPKYIARIVEALKPGGMVLIDRPYRSLTNPEPGWKETDEDKVNALAKAWTAVPGLQLVHYSETTGVGDWQQTSEDRLQHQLRIVRLLGRKL
jgi:SAM-dependent methyltransferase